MWPGSFVHHLDVVLPGDARQLALRLQLGELRLVVRVGDRARTQAVAERERDVVGAHDLADLAEVRVGEVLLVVRQAPLRHDRAAARDDAGHAPRGHRHVAEQDAGVHGEVVDALLALLDQRVAVDLPGEVLGAAADLLERLVDRHRADRHGRVPDNPLAGLVDVLPGREVHDRVGAPERRPAQLLDFLLDRGRHRGVADVGVDLHQEIAADDHRLELEVADVGRDDRAAARHFVADELGRQPLADGDELHLRRDLAFARVVQLRDAGVALPRSRPTARGASAGRAPRRGRADRSCRKRAAAPRRRRAAISRIGTRTPWPPSTYTLRELG